mgnify:CR=1 FL=1
MANSLILAFAGLNSFSNDSDNNLVLLLHYKRLQAVYANNFI